MATPLNLLVVVGSVRDSAPPRPARLGLRVARAMSAHLVAAGHCPELVDPLDISIPKPFKPHFAYPAGQAPAALETLAGRIGQSDGYVMVSPEYNHSMSPALADLLNHFGSSLFSFKPSAIVTYSAGQWGGTRAAVAMRTFLSELGCLPVSAMVHVPFAQDVFDEEGLAKEGVDGARWDSYFGRVSSQLAWWAIAAKRMRQEPGDAVETPAFTTSPSQRNAPPS